MPDPVSPPSAPATLTPTNPAPAAEPVVVASLATAEVDPPPGNPGTVNPGTVDANTARNAEPPVPVALAWSDLGLGEDVDVPESIQTEFLTALNERDADPKAFGKRLFDLHTKLLEEGVRSLEEQFTKTQTEWQEQIRNHPDFGGEKMRVSQTEIAKLMNRYGGKELRQALDLTGAGNHPAVFEFLLRVARDINEQGPVSGAPVSEARTDRATRLFGQTSQG